MKHGVAWRGCLSVSFQRCCIALIRTYRTTNECPPCWLLGGNRATSSFMHGGNVHSVAAQTYSSTAQHCHPALLCLPHFCHSHHQQPHSPRTHNALHQACTPIVVVFCQLAARITCSPGLTCWPGLAWLHVAAASVAGVYCQSITPRLFNPVYMQPS